MAHDRLCATNKEDSLVTQYSVLVARHLLLERSASWGARTPDPLIKSQLLYQLS